MHFLATRFSCTCIHHFASAHLLPSCSNLLLNGKYYMIFTENHQNCNCWVGAPEVVVVWMQASDVDYCNLLVAASNFVTDKHVFTKIYLKIWLKAYFASKKWPATNIPSVSYLTTNYIFYAHYFQTCFIPVNCSCDHPRCGQSNNCNCGCCSSAASQSNWSMQNKLGHTLHQIIFWYYWSTSCSWVYLHFKQNKFLLINII